MARKGENIYLRKDGRWEGRYIKGRFENGKVRYGYIYGSKYKDVKASLLVQKAKYTRERPNAQFFLGTVREWLLYWLEHFKRPYIKVSTYASYQSKMETHVIPNIGDIKLESLTTQDVQDMVNKLIKTKISSSSVRVVFRIFSGAVQNAVDKQYIYINPCSKVILPAIGKKENMAISLSEQKKLEKYALQTKGNEGIIIALYTGMRIGEISALTWDDIDFSQELIHVRRTLQRVPDYGGNEKKTTIVADIPKTDQSYRIIPLVGKLKSYLTKVKVNAIGRYVVTSRGKFAEPRVISYRFHRATEQLSMQPTKFHQLRHTFATRCMEQGVDVVTLSRILGHASTKMTLDVYADSTMQQRRKAMKQIGNLLSDTDLA